MCTKYTFVHLLKYLQWKFTPPVPHFWANTFTSLLHHQNTDPPEHSEEVSKVLKIADRFGSRLAFTDYVACNDQSSNAFILLPPPPLPACEAIGLFSHVPSLANFVALWRPNLLTLLLRNKRVG